MADSVDRMTHAFPVPATNMQETGMRLWDFYAAAALQGLLAADLMRFSMSADTAQWAAEHADAMMRERNERFYPVDSDD